MYLIELVLKFSPFPLSVQRKDLVDAEKLYRYLSECIKNENPTLIELTCDKVQTKKISVLTSNILAVQIYENSTSGLGSKRPGFSLNDSY